MVKLGDISVIQSGGTPSRSNIEYWKDGDIPWVKISDIKSKYVNRTEEKITVIGLKNCSSKIFKKGTILYTIFATLGLVGILDIDAATNQAIAGISFQSDIDVNFAYYCLQSIKSKINQIGRGVAQININLSILRDVTISLPPLEIQKQIAQTLDTAAELLAMRKQQLAELDSLIKSVFYDMFGDPVRNEKKWTLKKLGDIGELNSGGTPARKKPGYFLGNINWYSAGELNQRYLVESKEKLTEEAINDSSAKIFKKGSMLIGMYDTAAFKLGILTTDSSSNQACANIDVNKEIVNIEWLYDCAQIMRPNFLANRRGVRQQNLNLGMIRNFEVPIPPLKFQTQFASIVTKIEEQKSLVQKTIDETQHLFDSLMSEYFE
jgi:type I restriction enzyme S subunit